jgi:hypothetical protein
MARNGIPHYYHTVLSSFNYTLLPIFSFLNPNPLAGAVLVKYTGEDGTLHELAYEGSVAVTLVLDALGIQRGVFSDPLSGI